MWLRTAVLAFALCSCASLARAAETVYYIGEASTTGADGSVDRHTYLIARTSDQSAGTIAESAVTFTRGAYAETSSVMKVDGNRVSMTAGGIEGKGELTGKPWEWASRSSATTSSPNTERQSRGTRISSAAASS